MVIHCIIEGDLLETKQKYIAQQCNCITCKPHGLSKSISNKFKYGDIYGTRKKLTANTAIEEDRDEPGTIRILESDDVKKSPHIICIFGQWSPGSPSSKWIYIYPKYKNIVETSEQRLKWFEKAINYIDDDDRLQDEIISIPYKIGCGLAGGQWKQYKTILTKAKTKFIINKL